MLKVKSEVLKYQKIKLIPILKEQQHLKKEKFPFGRKLYLLGY